MIMLVAGDGKNDHAGDGGDDVDGQTVGKSGQQKWLWLGLIKRVMRALTGSSVGCTALGLALGCTWHGRESLAEQSVDSAQLWF